MAPSGRGLSPKVTGGEKKRLKFSPSVMTYGHATSLTEGGNKWRADVGIGPYETNNDDIGATRPHFSSVFSPITSPPAMWSA